MRLGRCDVAVLCAIMVLGCSSDGTGPGAGTPDVATNIPLYSGSIGLVVDARDIFKRGYRPRTAEISFDGQAAFNTVLTIDSLTDVAILVIQNDSLSAAQKTAFAAGIATTIVIRDANQSELGRVEDVLGVDDSNSPVSITTPLPALTPPLVLGSGAAYLLQPEGHSELVTRASVTTLGYVLLPYPQSNPARQQFTFTQELPDSTYLVGNVGAQDSIWCVWTPTPRPNTPPDPGFYPSPRQLMLDSLPPGDRNLCQGGPEAHLVLEQDADGWMRLKLKGTGEYVAWDYRGLVLEHVVRVDPVTFDLAPNSRDQATRFRPISDDIDWTLSDRGTSFDQPILPPARLDFAYFATLTNCSPATLTEVVGNSATRSTTRKFTTLESFQIFSGRSGGTNLKVGASVDIPLGGKLTGVDLTVSAEISHQWQWHTDTTSQHDNTFEADTTSTQEVSRQRSLLIPAFKAVTVTDYLKHIDNVVQPFTQLLRLRGAHRLNGAPLSGREIVSQMYFNVADGVITRVAAEYVEFTIRGEVHTDQFVLAETTVQEKVNACN